MHVCGNLWVHVCRNSCVHVCGFWVHVYKAVGCKVCSIGLPIELPIIAYWLLLAAIGSFWMAPVGLELLARALFPPNLQQPHTMHPTTAYYAPNNRIDAPNNRILCTQPFHRDAPNNRIDAPNRFRIDAPKIRIHAPNRFRIHAFNSTYIFK